MENVTKALLISAGVLFGLMIISITLFMHNNISNYYETKEANKVTEQLATFNNKYLIFQKDNLRGSDLLSLINKIIDFNKLKEDEDQKIQITIEIGNTSKSQEIYYQYSEFNYGTDANVTLIKINNVYTQDNIENVLREASRIENKYIKGKAEKLTANMSTLLGQNSLKTRDELLAELKINSVDNSDILKYYQYQQFKRAHFECKVTKFTDTGRVEKFEAKFNGKIQ